MHEQSQPGRRGDVDAVIFGGGIAGLWILDELTRRGCEAILLEASELGRGQTIASQGIIHGGLKYTLGDGLSRDRRSAAAEIAVAIRDMPRIWRECLTGRREPDLSRTIVRAEFCHLWRTDSIKSRLGMLGARVGLRIRPIMLEDHERPDILANCPGGVARLDEQVIDPASLLNNLAMRHTARIRRCALDHDLRIRPGSPGVRISLTTPELRTQDFGVGEPSEMRISPDESERAALTLSADACIFAAGEGNARLREIAGLGSSLMQRRPLHMVMVRAAHLPALNGHCVDGNRTRATITSAIDSQGRTVWQIGGRIAEDGVGMDQDQLVAHAQHELHAVLGGYDPDDEVEWATYRVDRAEASTASGARPDDVFVQCDGPFITCWPTKLALAPRLAERVADAIETLRVGRSDTRAAPRRLPCETLEALAHPTVATPPWETERSWTAARLASRP